MPVSTDGTDTGRSVPLMRKQPHERRASICVIAGGPEMTPEQQREVWEMLDKGHLVEVTRKGPEPIFATISGAHLYGFASPDSDVDLRETGCLSSARASGGLGMTGNHWIRFKAQPQLCGPVSVGSIEAIRVLRDGSHSMSRRLS